MYSFCKVDELIKSMYVNAARLNQVKHMSNNIIRSFYKDCCIISDVITNFEKEMKKSSKKLLLSLNVMTPKSKTNSHMIIPTHIYGK